MSGSVRKVLPNFREALSYVREWSGGPPGCAGVVGRPSRMSGSGREACRISGSGRKAIPNVWEWSGGPPQMSRSGRETLPDVQE